MRKPVAVTILFAGALALTVSSATADYSLFEKKLSNDQQVLHALDRLTFGPRPGDVEAVKKVGLKKWIEAQLHPERVTENAQLAAKLAPLDSLRMSPAEAVAAYPPPQLIRAIAQGKQAFPDNPLVRAAIQRAADRLKVRGADDPRAETGQERLRRGRPLAEFLTPEQIRTLRSGTPEEKRETLQSIPEDKLDDVVLAMPQQMRQQLIAAAKPDLRRKIIVASAPGQVIASDLTEAKLYRAIYSTRQLEEVMVDFWFNHFNVYVDKGADRVLTAAYERDAIRPHVFGKFRDLLEATAESPAMLFYLDNWQSVDPDAQQFPLLERLARQKGKQLKQNRRGLNENYARELMELHTLGVDGGYTQKDVTEVARCFTGWTIRQPNLGGAFFYNDRVHDKGEKVVLGVKIPAGGGREDAEKVLDILAKHPSTAHFISRKLAQKFVADDPPPALVERMAKTFQSSDGDIRAVLEAIIHAPEFFSQGAWRAKVKTPFEMIVSAVRATSADVEFAAPLAQQLNQLGQPLYRKVEPTGYSNANAEWVNSAALLGRMNFSLALAANRVPGVRVDASKYSDQPAEAARQVLFRDPAAQTLRSIEKALAEPPADAALDAASVPVTVTGLVLGSPDFQRR
jgi:uncharacterized protein (DUF1800 family)